MSWLDVLSLWCGFVTFGLVGGWSPLTVALGLLALGAGLFRGSLQIPRAWLLPMALVLVILVFLAPLALPEQTGFVGLPSFRVAVFCAVLVIVSLLRQGDSGEQVVLLCMGVSLTMACGMTMQREPYIYLVAAQLSLFVLALRSRLPGQAQPRSLPWLPALFLVPVLTLALGLTLILGWSETQLNEWLQNFDYGINTVNFPNSTRLNSLRSSQNSPMLIVRVFSQQPPAYLVGRSYIRYHDFTWDVEPGKQDLTGEPRGELWHYPLGTASGPGVRDTCELSAVEAASLLLPRDACSLQLRCQHMTRFGGGSWQVQGPDFNGSYQLERTPGRFVQQERPASFEPYLQLPSELSAEVGRLAREVAGTAPPMKQAAALESYFHEHFEYGYGYPFEDQADPLEAFLTRRPAAHCELFACSLALMLRTLGIPSRYIVGFLVRERSPMGGYSVVRARDAHAWVEAYIEPQGWVQFDPTPPQALTPPGGVNSWLESFTERLFYHWGRLLKILKSNPLQLLRELWGLVRSPWALSALVLVVVLLALRRAGGWRWQRRAASPSRRPEDPEVERLQLLLHQLEGRLAKRGWHRPQALTLLQWRHQLDETPTDEKAAALDENEQRRYQQFLEEYCRIRYAQERPTGTDLESLERYLTTD